MRKGALNNYRSASLHAAKASQQPKGARREGIGHLEVVRLLDLGGGRVDADPEDVVVGALLHHGGKLPGSRRPKLREPTNN